MPFESLQIDFEAIERRKSAEYEKLNLMVAYAQSRSCRQQEILTYFGESTSPPCDHCDNCERSSNRHGKLRDRRRLSLECWKRCGIVLSGAANQRPLRQTGLAECSAAQATKK